MRTWSAVNRRSTLFFAAKCVYATIVIGVVVVVSCVCVYVCQLWSRHVLLAELRKIAAEFVHGDDDAARAPFDETLNETAWRLAGLQCYVMNNGPWVCVGVSTTRWRLLIVCAAQLGSWVALGYNPADVQGDERLPVARSQTYRRDGVLCRGGDDGIDGDRCVCVSRRPL